MPESKNAQVCILLRTWGGNYRKGQSKLKVIRASKMEKYKSKAIKQEPLCARCLNEGKVTSGAHVDHVFPHRRDNARFTVNLFQTLCQSCHTLKTQDENRGRYLHYTRNGIIEYTDGDYFRIMGGYI